MKNHIVKIGNSTNYFKEIESLFDIPFPVGIQISGTGTNVTEFVNNLDLENQWFPYNYFIKYVWNAGNCNYIAFLSKLS